MSYAYDTSKQAFTLWWVAEDKQSSMPCGEYASKEAAESAIPARRTELLGQCGQDSGRAAIEAGAFSVEAPSE